MGRRPTMGTGGVGLVFSQIPSTLFGHAQRSPMSVHRVTGSGRTTVEATRLTRTGHSVGAGLLSEIGSRPSSIVAEVGFPLGQRLDRRRSRHNLHRHHWSLLELARSDFITPV